MTEIAPPSAELIALLLKHRLRFLRVDIIDSEKLPEHERTTKRPYVECRIRAIDETAPPRSPASLIENTYVTYREDLLRGSVNARTIWSFLIEQIIHSAEYSRLRKNVLRWMPELPSEIVPSFPDKLDSE